jgi:hypothetical protein
VHDHFECSLGITTCSLLWRTNLSYQRHHSQLGRFPEIKTNSWEQYLLGLLTCLAQVRRPIWLGVRLFYLLTVGLGLAGLTLGSVLIFCGFGLFCLGLRRLAGGILRLRDRRVLNDRGI